jgi:hypothetical protein
VPSNIDHIEWDAQTLGYPTRVGHLVRSAATICRNGSTRLLFTPKAHHHTDDIITLIDQKCGRNRTIDTATHGNDDSLAGLVCDLRRHIYPSDTF